MFVVTYRHQLTLKVLHIPCMIKMSFLRLLKDGRKDLIVKGLLRGGVHQELIELLKMASILAPQLN